MNQLSNYKRSSQIQMLKADFVSAGFTIDDEDVAALYELQIALCEKLEWVELDSHKVQKILEPFIFSGYLYHKSYKKVLRHVISTYYHVRVLFDCTVSDKRICEVILQVFYDLAGRDSASLFEKSKAILHHEGGGSRYERFDEF